VHWKERLTTRLEAGRKCGRVHKISYGRVSLPVTLPDPPPAAAAAFFGFK
jgi:hypothetical protein